MKTKPPLRLRRLPAGHVAGRIFPVASNLRSRLLGLSLLRPGRAGPGLVLPGCRSVHTFGMLFALDVYFFDRRGRLVRVASRVAPGRVLFERRATWILEVPAGSAALFGDQRHQSPPSGPAEGGESLPGSA
jgi:uncharacterized membrane protein (UPF0127 family)